MELRVASLPLGPEQERSPSLAPLPQLLHNANLAACEWLALNNVHALLANAVNHQAMGFPQPTEGAASSTQQASCHWHLEATQAYAMKLAMWLTECTTANNVPNTPASW